MTIHYDLADVDGMRYLVGEANGVRLRAIPMDNIRVLYGAEVTFEAMTNAMDVPADVIERALDRYFREARERLDRRLEELRLERIWLPT